MQVQVIVNSAHSLKNVNWRYGTLHPYAVVWIDSSGKCSTKIDLNNNMNPVWNEKFSIPLPPTSFVETAILHIDIVHANAAPGTKPLIGSVRFPLCTVLNEARANGKVLRCLNLLRPSGRPQGTVEIMVGLKDPNVGQINQFNQQAPCQQHPAQPLPQAYMQPQVQFQARPQIQPQAQFPPKPQAQPPAQYQARPQTQPQVQIQPKPQVQLPAQFQPRQQVQPQVQFQPKPQKQPQGQFKSQPKGQVQPQLIAQPQSKYPPQQQVPPQRQFQPRPLAQPRPQLQSQVQPRNQYPNNRAPVRPVVDPQNSQGLARPRPVQGPKYSMPAGTNRPAYRPVMPGPVQKQNNSALGMGTVADITKLSRAMLIQQNQNVQQENNPNSNANAAPVAAGTNDNEQIQCAPSADEGTDNSTEKYAEETYTVDNYAVETYTVENYAEETYTAETNNDAESTQLSYAGTPEMSAGCDGGAYYYSEYAAEEYNNEGYDVNAGVESDNGVYDMSVGGECENGGYDMQAAGECENGGYDMNAGGECENGGYDMNPVEECDNGVYDNGDYADIQSDGAGLDNQGNCEEVNVSYEY